ncbi:MAG: J domain-containing protein [Alphaproteobacteria bacterium]|nr:J domain-containing protein [Alphaproteobacteria bacterium]
MAMFSGGILAGMCAEKYNDPFLATLDRPVKKRLCDHPNCGQAGDFRAPKSRENLNEYYWFCLQHVREYNAAWDFLSGMSEEDIEKHIRNSTVWERPSWPLGEWRKFERMVRDFIDKDFFGGEKSSGAESESQIHPAHIDKAMKDALVELELPQTADFAAIKAQYRVLVKRHHPDANAGSRESEEKFKRINQAFAILRAVYEDDDYSI